MEDFQQLRQVALPLLTQFDELVLFSGLLVLQCLRTFAVIRSLRTFPSCTHGDRKFVDRLVGHDERVGVRAFDWNPVQLAGKHVAGRVKAAHVCVLGRRQTAIGSLCSAKTKLQQPDTFTRRLGSDSVSGGVRCDQAADQNRN